jgi:hypothetical protein
MNAILRRGVRALLLGIGAAAASPVWAEMPPQPNARASLVVEGVVREGFQSVRTTTVDHVFAIEVRSARLGTQPELPYDGPVPKPGDVIYVRAFQRTPDAPPIPGPGGYRELPAEGSVIVAYLYPRAGAGWQFAYPLGFEVQGRISADDLGPLTPQPARTMPITPGAVPPAANPVSPVAVSPVPVVVAPSVIVGPPRRLGVQGVPIVIADQRGLRITMVVPGSVAARAGLVPGDVILKAGGMATRDLSVLTDHIVNAGPRLPLLVRRAATGTDDVVEVDFGPVR